MRRVIMADDTNPENSAPTDVEAGKQEVVSEVEALRRRNVSLANDGADGAHQGGMGAQGSQVDFGNPQNFGS
jgi:hypothetical protein